MMLTTTTRLRLEKLIERLEKGEQVTLNERIELHKYAIRFPMVAGKLSRVVHKVSN
ncbi:hypothetical protein [Prochlorococcus sp. MIT 1300]|uniref:hypothetical protein n=1 Tax=Prochlorococcus sp. MIT 1300 TaxID=3096218 RepID=UPI002A75E0FC|nr:hypothetical protein [Prochlorococcus sp. MIT 1300]